jgi:hypothetical protein
MLRLEIDMSTGAFKGRAYDEAARILRAAAAQLERSATASATLKDANGVTCGSFRISPNASF